jgi:hypothetical protein
MTAKSTSQTAVDPIRAVLVGLVKWSKPLPVWQQDALRRLYLTGKLSEADFADLSNLCRHAHGLLEEGESSLTPEPLESAHVPAQLDLR